jgi:hypothetical protein
MPTLREISPANLALGLSFDFLGSGDIISQAGQLPAGTPDFIHAPDGVVIGYSILRTRDLTFACPRHTIRSRLMPLDPASRRHKRVDNQYSLRS